MRSLGVLSRADNAVAHVAECLGRALLHADHSNCSEQVKTAAEMFQQLKTVKNFPLFSLQNPNKIFSPYCPNGSEHIFEQRNFYNIVKAFSRTVPLKRDSPVLRWLSSKYCPTE